MAKKRKSNKVKKFFNIKSMPRLIMSIFGIIIGLTLGLNIKVLGKVFNGTELKIDKNYVNILNDAIKEKTENITQKTIGTIEKENTEEKNIKDEKIKYKVIKVSDGDTISVKKLKNGVLDGDLIKVRLYGVDAPEKDQDFGYESKKALMNYVADKTIEIDIKAKDRYGRSVGVLYVGGRNINEELLRDGYVWYYEQYDKNNERSRLLQENAMKNKLGLFSKKGYVEPWKFRKQKKKN